MNRGGATPITPTVNEFIITDDSGSIDLGEWYNFDIGYVDGDVDFLPIATYSATPEVQWEGGVVAICKSKTSGDVSIRSNPTELIDGGYISDWIEVIESITDVPIRIVGHYDTLQEASDALLTYLP